MIRNVILALGGFVVIGLLVLWILNGGPSKVYRSVKSLAFFSTTTSSGVSFALPWQPDGLVPRIEQGDLFPSDTSAYTNPDSADAEFASLKEEYARLEAETQGMANVGNPSPHFGNVVISNVSSSPASNYQTEYLVLESRLGNTTPISLAGWSLQSAITGNTAPISGAASLFWMGAVNTLDPVRLGPGESAYISSGSSPVGVSFRENKCTGYLSQFQTFEPSLSLRCPAPEQEIPLNEQTMQQLGAECVDMLPRIPTCTFPQELPNANPQCRSHVQTVLSYNGCVGRHSAESDFFENSWRLYTGVERDTWGNAHDAIRLLDAEGKVVNVYVY